MNLRNGKTTALKKVVESNRGDSFIQPIVEYKDRLKEYTTRLKHLMTEVNRYKNESYMKVRSLGYLYEFVDENIDTFKDDPNLVKLKKSIRDSSRHILSDIGGVAIRHGLNRDYSYELGHLGLKLLSVLAKLGPE